MEKTIWVIIINFNDTNWILENPKITNNNITNVNTKDLVLLEKKKLKVKPPKLFKVILLNDDFTPMEFVIDVLRKVFSMNNDKATLIMLAVHNKGKGVCGIYPRDIASTKVSQVISLARESQHPLQCLMEEE